MTQKFLAIFLLLFILACSSDDEALPLPEESPNCTNIVNAPDTLDIGDYKIWFNSFIDTSNIIGSAVEIVNERSGAMDSISTSLELVQLKNAGNCWETDSFKRFRIPLGSNVPVYGYYDAPAWALDSNTVTTIEFKILDDSFYIKSPRQK